MSGSTSPNPQVVEGTGAVSQINENFDAVSPAAMAARDPTTSGLLTWGYLASRISGVDKAAGTVALTASNTNYIVMAKSGLAVTASTATTNWIDTTNYWRLYSVVTNGTTATSWVDERTGTAGLFGIGSAAGTFTGGTLTSALNEAPQVTIASAATVNIGAAAANTVIVSGTTTITAFDSIATGAIRRVRFLAALLLTHNATSLILPGSANITTAAGDVATFESLGSGNWRCVGYDRANGTAVAGAGSGTVTSVDATGGLETASGSAITASGTIRLAELVNAQIGTSYTYLTGDRGKVVTHSNAAAIAGTLPQATGTFPAGWRMIVKNRGAGTLTITPTTSTIDGAATLVLTTGQWAIVTSDGTNYQAMTYAPASGGGGLTNITEALSTASPNATNNVASLTVTGGTTNTFLALAPKGAGGLLAQVPDSAATGGNARGSNAVDWQQVRGAATNVAGATRSVIGGGYGNTIPSGADYTVISGGFNNVGGASGATHCVVAGGNANNLAATGSYNTISGGSSNTISGSGSGNTICGGASNTATGIQGAVLGGANNTVTGNNSAVVGNQARTRGTSGTFVHASGLLATQGDAQYERYVVSISTANATPTALTTTQGAAGATSQPLLASGSAMAFTGVIVARNISTGDTASWAVSGAIKNFGGTVSLVGTPTVTALGVDAGASAWVLAVAADNTNKCLQINGTGAAATTIRWSGHLHVEYVA